MTLLASGLGLLLLLALGASGWWYQQQQAVKAAKEMQEQAAQGLREKQAEADVIAALNLAPKLHNQYQFEAAGVLLEQAKSRLSALREPEKLAEQISQSQRNLQTVEKLDRIRLAKNTSSFLGFSTQSANGADGDYAKTFRAHGLDVLKEDSVQLAKKIQRSPIAQKLIDGLDDWSLHETEAFASLIRGVAAEADRDPVSKKLRDQKPWQNPAEMEELLGKLDLREISPFFVGMLSLQLRQVGHKQRALKLLEDALVISPDDFWMHFQLALVMEDLGFPLESQISQYQMALAIRPNTPAVINNLTILLEKQHNYRKAEQLCRRGLEVHPKNALLHDKLGVNLKLQKRFPESEQAYREAIRLEPNLAHAHCNLGNVLTEQKRFEEGERHIRTAILIFPQRAIYYVNLALCLKDQQRISEADQAFQKALELDSRFAPAYANLGEMRKEQGRPEEAESALRRATEIDPRDAESWWHLGVVLQMQKKYQAAEESYQKALKWDPLFIETPNSLGILYSELKRYPEAEAAFQKAIALDPQFYLAHFNLAFVYLALGDYPKAEACCQQTIKVNPKFPPAYGVLSMVLLNQKRFAEALAIAEAGQQLVGKNSMDAARFASTIQNIRQQMLQKEQTTKPRPAVAEKVPPKVRNSE